MIVAIQGGLIANYVAMAFISRMRGETFVWLLLFTAALYEITKRLQDENKLNLLIPKPKTKCFTTMGRILNSNLPILI
jgi:hypothetical protein